MVLLSVAVWPFTAALRFCFVCPLVKRCSCPAVDASRVSARQPTYFFASPKSRQKRRPLRWRSAARTAHVAGAEIGKRPKLAGAQTAAASLSDFGASDVSPSDGDSLQRQLQRQLHRQSQRSLRGATCNCNCRCAKLIELRTAHAR